MTKFQYQSDRLNESIKTYLEIKPNVDEFFLRKMRSGGSVVDNMLDYQSWDCKIDPLHMTLLVHFGWLVVLGLTAL